MICSNCGNQIVINASYIRAGRNGTSYCSLECAYEAYEGYYTRKQVDETIELCTNYKQ